MHTVMEAGVLFVRAELGVELVVDSVLETRDGQSASRRDDVRAAST